jgi:hypothetical protein
MAENEVLRTIKSAWESCHQKGAAGKKARSATVDGTPYLIDGGSIARMVNGHDGSAHAVKLCNFAAVITEEISRDDGNERQVVFGIDGKLATGEILPRAVVPAGEFQSMAWMMQHWGSRAIMYAGTSNKDHLRTAIQVQSKEVSRRTVYTHTGWREIQGHWCYLHGGGAITKMGNDAGVSVDLPPSLAEFQLPAPPAGAELVAAIHASMSILHCGPTTSRFRCTPCCGAPYCAHQTWPVLRRAAPARSRRSWPRCANSISAQASRRDICQVRGHQQRTASKAWPLSPRMHFW